MYNKIEKYFFRDKVTENPVFLGYNKNIKII